MLFINPYLFASPRSSDADVNAYILAVESADGQQLEAGVITAVETFVLGCKSDGIWSAIKASCILAGARSLSGALVPLVGTAPTNNNFVTADYNRETGLVGNGSTKNIAPNRNNNADPQNSKHFSFFSNTLGSTASGTYYIGYGTSLIQRQSGAVTTRLNDGINSVTATSSIGFMGISRSDSSSYVLRNNATNFVKNVASTVNSSDLNGKIFSSRINASYGNACISFYSIGESLDLALLDTRVSTLMTDLAAAIPRDPVSDVDALAYIAAVETADAQTLEDSVKFAYEDFIVGCKSDGIWSAIKTSCILAGARTLSGALVPLVGAAPTSINFVSGDYNRKTGLVGNTTTKYLNSNRSADADPQNNASLAIWVSTPATASNIYYLGAVKTTPTPVVSSSIITNIGFSLRANTNAPNSFRANSGFAGVSRTSSTAYNWRWASGAYTGSLTSSNSIGTYSGNLFVYGGNINGAIANRSNGRLAFYSIGESLNLALLDTRVSNLMTALAASNI